MPSRDAAAGDRQIIVMGVMGAGKTTIGQTLARHLDWPFFDADDFHSGENIIKLASGVPLDADDRGPWVERLAALITRLHDQGESAVIACSALTETIRQKLAAASDGVVFVYLRADPAVVTERLQLRAGHFADPALLGSQYAVLEPPADAIAVDTAAAPDQIVREIMNALNAAS